MSKKWFEKGGLGHQLPIAALGRYLYRGEHLGRLMGVLGHFLSTLDRFGLDLRRILLSFREVWASKMTSWARFFFLLIPSHECS